jgi:hypothetical protein
MATQVPRLQNLPEDFERYVAARERMQAEVQFRRERQWNVFSWISNLLLAIIGGTIALYSNGRDFATLHKWLLTAAVGLFALFGVIRIRHDLSVSIFYTESCLALDDVFGLRFDDSKSKRWHLGHAGFLVLMAITTVGVIWCPVEPANALASQREAVSGESGSADIPISARPKRQNEKPSQGKAVKQ